MVSTDQFQGENRHILCKYPTLHVSSSLPSSAGADSIAVIESYFHLVQEKPLLMRVTHIDTFLWKMMLMNSHFPVKKSVSAIFTLQIFQSGYDVGKSMTWLCIKREILSVFHWKMAFSGSFWDTSVRMGTARGRVPCLKSGLGGRQGWWPLPAVLSVHLPHLFSIKHLQLWLR